MGLRFATMVFGASLLTASATWAQESSTNRVGEETAWSIFTEQDPVECWAVSQPTEWVATRGGNVVAANRGDILLFVFYRPSADVTGQVTFTGGYPFANDSTVTVRIGSDEFTLYTDNIRDAEGDNVGWAWPANPEDDARIVAAMRRGATATVIGVSTRGTTTTDTFSLLGFTAASEDAARRCSG